VALIANTFCAIRIQTVQNSDTVTVSQILDRYERECVPSLAPRTQKDYARHLIHLRSIFGERVAAELKPRDFGPFLNNNGKARGRIQKVRQLAVLSAAFTQAVSFWYWGLEANPLRDVKRPKSFPRDRLIGDDEFEGCKAIAPIRVKLSMRLALKTGQRQGDILDFKWADISEREIDDPKNPGKKIMLSELNVYQSKTGKRLAIGIDAELEQIMDDCWKLKNGGNAGSPYVLPTRSGKRYTSEGYRATWQRCMKKWMRQGGQNFHFHDIRALCATKCKTPEEAMRLLGHTTIAMTMRVYRRGIERVQCLPGEA
jgi:integrase